jgi:uncharacterized NAD-dependent epimerase/dehydratase family protein
VNSSPQLQKATTRIAVIDTGVDRLQMSSVSLAGAVTVRQVHDDEYVTETGTSDPVGHGSAVVAAVAARALEASIFSVGLGECLDEDSPTALVHGIRWCIEQKMKVVNISVGSTCQAAREPLAQVCQQAAEAGIIIVAAEHNDGLVSYPAHLPSVIGVRGARVFGDETYYYHPDQPIECIARGDAQRVRWLHGKDVMIGGSSFAAPRITAIIARLKQQVPDAGLEQIRSLLQDGATRIIQPSAQTATRSDNGTNPQALPAIRQAALYPYTKEMHSLVRFRDLLSFDIAGVADPPGRGLAGRDAGEAIGAPEADIRIGSSVRDATEAADTLILGYLKQLGGLRRRDLHRECLTLALERGLHVFCFEPLPEAEYGELLDSARQQGLRFCWPRVSRDEAQATLSEPDAHGPVDRPVLGVAGTSASQGKFTLQLALRRRFIQMGYRVGQIGTEHHAALFGMDFAFPMGHGSTVDLAVDRYPEFVDRVMRRINAEDQPDLLLVGAQSGTVPFDLNDHRTMTLPTLAFLLGARPDAVILVVNDIDPEDYIEDTIAGLRAVVHAEVIALAVSDRGKQLNQRHGRSWMTQRQDAPAELQATLQRLQERFGLPVVQITSEAGIIRVSDTVVAHFSRSQEAAQCQRKSA